MQATVISKKLIPWHKQHGRHDLPWQQQPTPYRVWVSEIMLQQTQVETVRAYYLRFMQQLPTLQDLAAATEETVLQLWTGLGYYARARHLHRAAKIILQTYEGHFPETLETLIQLPGIGPSTAGAILSLSMQQSAVILDGNVKRVLARIYAIDAWPGKTSVQKKLWDLARLHTPKKNAHIYNQALMDLGATLCSRSTPHCNACPLRTQCLSYQQNLQDIIPVPRPQRILPEKVAHMLVLIHKKNNTILLEKRAAPGIWGGLWCFPECPRPGKTLEAWLPAKTLYLKTAATLSHTFTHYRWHIHPVIVSTSHMQIPKACAQQNYAWYPLDGSTTFALAAAVKKLLPSLQNISLVPGPWAPRLTAAD